MPIADFARRYFYTESGETISLAPHQALILDIVFNPAKYNLPQIRTALYSTIKKSGKSTISGLVARWAAECWGGEQQVYCVANDQEQARGRIYQFFLTSLEQSPNWDRQHRVLKDNQGNAVWRVIERDSRHVPSGTIIRAVSSDYRGEAGSNPSVSLFTELWGSHLERDRRLWDELTPPPTRRRGLRWVDSYAGFIGESVLLWDLWRSIKEGGRRLTRDEVPQWPFEDDPPFWINEAAQQFGYIDQGEVARRMPWQQGEYGNSYYAEEYASLRPEAFRRLHYNEWVGNADSFIPIELWDNCKDESIKPLTVGDRTPLVVGVDASVSSDCTGLVAVSRHPVLHREVAVRLVKKFTPPQGGKLDYGSTIEPTIREWCRDYNVMQVCYDSYQLHYLMSELRNQRVAWCQPFNQGMDRNKADKALYDLIRDRQMHHDGTSDDMRDHILNAAAQMAPKEDTKLRIVKKDADSKIDLVVALSMAASRCLYLNL